MSSITLPVSIGEALDKLSILDIKLRRISDGRRANVQHEYDLLYKELEQHILAHKFYYKLLVHVNETIWDNQDVLRGPQQQSFTPEAYADLCRKILDDNDMRFRIKNKINTLVNSAIREQKGYAQKQGMIISHMGLGDVVNILSAIRYYSLVYDKLYLVVKYQYCANISALIGNDPTIEYIDAKCVHPNNYDTCYPHNILCDLAKAHNAEPIFGGFYATNPHPLTDMPLNFYKDFGLPTTYYKLYSYIPEYIEQRHHLERILKETPNIVFTHRKASNREIQYTQPLDENTFYCDPCTSHYQPGHRFYELAESLLNLPIVLYSKIMEAAKEMHLVDSVFACLAAHLDTSVAAGRKYIYIPYSANGYNMSADIWNGFTIIHGSNTA